MGATQSYGPHLLRGRDRVRVKVRVRVRVRVRIRSRDRVRLRLRLRLRARARVRVYRVRRHAGLWPTAEECASAAHSMALSRTTCHGAASAAAFPPIGSPPVRHVAAQQALQQLSWRRPRCSTKKVATSSLPRVLKVQLFSSIDHPPPCTIQVQQIVTNRISTARALQAQSESCGG